MILAYPKNDEEGQSFAAVLQPKTCTGKKELSEQKVTITNDGRTDQRAEDKCRIYVLKTERELVKSVREVWRESSSQITGVSMC